MFHCFVGRHISGRASHNPKGTAGSNSIAVTSATAADDVELSAASGTIHVEHQVLLLGYYNYHKIIMQQHFSCILRCLGAVFKVNLLVLDTQWEEEEISSSPPLTKFGS